jgi:hypothetical protein
MLIQQHVERAKYETGRWTDEDCTGGKNVWMLKCIMVRFRDTYTLKGKM